MIKLRINKIVRFLLISDFIFYAGWGLVSPIFAIFIVDKVPGGDVMAIGVAMAIYSIIGSLLRVGFGIFLDNQPNEKTDYYFLVSGLFVASLVPLGFIFVSSLWEVYILQAIHAVGIAMNTSGWSAIFTRHIDKGHEATEWGISATTVGVGTGLSELVGGLGISYFGFDAVFLAVSLIGLAGAAILLAIRKDFEKSAGHGLYFSFKELTQKWNE